VSKETHTFDNINFLSPLFRKLINYKFLSMNEKELTPNSSFSFL